MWGLGSSPAPLCVQGLGSTCPVPRLAGSPGSVCSHCLMQGRMTARGRWSPGSELAEGAVPRRSEPAQSMGCGAQSWWLSPSLPPSACCCPLPLGHGTSPSDLLTL